MRVLLIALILVGATAVSLRSADVHAASDDAIAAPVAQGSYGGVDLDDDDDDVFEVQLLVLGVVIGTVFVLGTGAYLLRRKLGLTAYTPPADTGHH